MIDEKLLISPSGRASFGSVAGECHASQNDAQHILAEVKAAR